MRTVSIILFLCTTGLSYALIWRNPTMPAENIYFLCLLITMTLLLVCYAVVSKDRQERRFERLGLSDTPPRCRSIEPGCSTQEPAPANVVKIDFDKHGKP